VKNVLKRVSTALLVTTLVFSTNTNVYAKEVVTYTDCVENHDFEVETRANYGVPCTYCGKYEDMVYLWTEQAGMGGTTYIMYFYCKNCKTVTTDYLYARSLTE